MDEEDFPRVEFGGKSMFLPVTEGSIYRCAYHGTSEELARRIEESGTMKPGSGGYYGSGIYFWLYNVRVAIWWASDRCGHGDDWAVVKAKLDCNRTLHAEQIWEDKMLYEAVEEKWGEGAVPDDFTSRHWKSRAVAIVMKICEYFDIEVDSLHYTRSGIGPFMQPVCAVALYLPEAVQNIEEVPKEDVHSYWKEFRDA